MSDAEKEHQSLIKTPKQLMVVIVAAFLVPIIFIVLLVKFVNSSPMTGAGSEAMTPEATAARIAPVASFEVAAADPPAPAGGAVAAAPEAVAPTKVALVAPVAPESVITAIAAANASAASGAQASADPGEKLFNGVCIACHGQGVAGAPKFGDKAAWAPRIAQGMDTLYEHALKGFQGKAGVMPAKGGSNASDDDVKAAVQYMVKAGK